jgi:4-aminobutyrate aminotransferase/(S)-3-amino-2-methylpropionate transaminase
VTTLASEGNAGLLARRAQTVSAGVATATAVYADRALNAEIWDVEGRRYIDFVGGIGVLNVGHRHPRVMQAVRDQLDRFTHTAFQVMAYEPYIALGERLNRLAPIDGPAKTVLLTTGAEAVENAVKIARAATGRFGVIAFTGGFHGRTALSMALTGKVAPYKQTFGPPAAGVFHAPFPSYGVSVEDSLRGVRHILSASLAPSQTAAIIFEPVQGEGGFHPAPHDFVRDLRRLCDRHGILLIADEVQSGFARTGRLFAIEHSGIAPDLIAIAKSLAGGLPLSGVIGRADLMDAVEPGGLGGTYGGSPLACAAALAVLDVVETEGLLQRADAIGDRIKSRLGLLAQRNDLAPISGIRGPGAMVAFDLVKDAMSQAPDGPTAKRVVRAAMARGLMLLSCGSYGETIRILVPLTASDEIIEEGLQILEASMAPET